MEEEKGKSLAILAISMQVFAKSYETHFGGKILRNTKQLRVCRPFHFWLCLCWSGSDGSCLARKSKEVWFSPWLGFRRLSQSMFMTKVEQRGGHPGPPLGPQTFFPGVPSCTGWTFIDFSLPKICTTKDSPGLAGLSESAIVNSSVVFWVFF